MKKVFYPLACCCLAAGVFASCGGQKKANAPEEQKVALTYSKSLKAAETDSLNLPVDENGYITIFDGETFNGWRGYGKDRVPTKWTIEDGCIKFNGSGGGEAQDGDGGDLIFAHKFKNFELEMEWKVSKGGNSGIFYLAQEVTSKDMPEENQKDATTAEADASKKDAKAEQKTVKYIRQERYSGNVSRSFYVGENLEEKDIHAKFENGTLTLTFPKELEKKAVEEKHFVSIEG